MAAGLTPDTQRVLNSSSPRAVSDSFGGLASELAACRWISCANRYRDDLVSKISQDFRRGSLSHSDLVTYIAASAPLHCVDGWSFLGRALHAHTVGDSHISRHLAYYAELRAATCILASQGVGVFGNQHFIVNGNGSCQWIPSRCGTHEMAWLGIQHWASGSSSADVLADIVHPGGIPLREWLNAFNGLTSWRPVGEKWLTTWGLDLRHFSQDRNARNEAAYRPTGVRTSGPLPTVQTCEFVRNLWAAYEPGPHSGFERLDSHLLRRALEIAYQAIHRMSHETDLALYRTRVERMLEALSLDVNLKERWKHFLMRSTEPQDTALLRLAQKQPDLKSAEYHVQVISRAALLLRVATGVSAGLLAANQVCFDDLKFWWSSLAVERGFWGSESEPISVTDLWRDVEDATTTIGDWEDSNGPSDPPLAQFRASCAAEMSLLGNCELIGLWGLEVR